MTDPHIDTFFDNNKDSDVLEALAKMRIIGRFDDEGEYSRIEECYISIEL